MSESALEMPAAVEALNPSPYGDEASIFDVIDQAFAEKEAPPDKTAPEATPEAPAAAPEKAAVEGTSPEKTAADLVAEADENLAKGKSPRAPQWDALRQLKVKAEQEAETLRKELETLRNAPKVDPEKEVLAAEVPKLRQKVEEYEQKVKVFDVEASREYQETVTIPAERIRDATLALCERAGLDKAAAMEAYLNTDPKARSAALSELAANLNHVDQIEFLQNANAFSQLMATREHIRANAQTAWQELETRKVAEAAAAKLRAQEAWKTDSNRVWEKLSTNLKDILPDIPEAGTLLSTVQARSAENLTTVDQSLGQFAANLLPSIVKKAREQAKEIAQLKASLSKTVAATPGAGPSGGAGAPGSASEDDDGLSIGEAIARKLGSR